MIFKNLVSEHLGMNINGKYLSYLRFTDDIILFFQSGSQLEQNDTPCATWDESVLNQTDDQRFKTTDKDR